VRLSSSMVHTVVRFVDSQLAVAAAKGRRKLPGELPEEMLDPTVPSNGDWRAWQPIPSTLTEDALLIFESEAGIHLPPTFRRLLLHVHFLELEGPRIR
jgi:hypothetical protein